MHCVYAGLRRPRTDGLHLAIQRTQEVLMLRGLFSASFRNNAVALETDHVGASLRRRRQPRILIALDAESGKEVWCTCPTPRPQAGNSLCLRSAEAPSFRRNAATTSSPTRSRI